MDILCVSLGILLLEQNISKVSNNWRSVITVVTPNTIPGISLDQAQSNGGENSENKTENWTTIEFAGMFMSQTTEGLSLS